MFLPQDYILSWLLYRGKFDSVYWEEAYSNTMQSWPMCSMGHLMFRSSYNSDNWKCFRCSTANFCGERWYCVRCSEQQQNVCFGCAPISDNRLGSSPFIVLSFVLGYLFNFIGPAIIAFFLGCYIMVVSEPDSHYNWSNSSLFTISVVLFAMSIISSFLRSCCGQLSVLSYIANIKYLNSVCRANKFSLQLIGSCHYSRFADLPAQIICYAVCGIITNKSYSSLLLVGASMISLADYFISTLRFTHGRCILQEPWKPCPLLDQGGLVSVYQDRPSKIFALSYRWDQENANGFSENNTASLKNIFTSDNINAGFIDIKCKWDDGSMATLDVNRSIYSEANKHYIFMDRKAFTHIACMMRSFMAIVLPVVGTCFAIVIWRRTTDLFIYICLGISLLVTINHSRHYVAYNLLSVIPGPYRVWLRLEYECRRQSDDRRIEASILFDQEGPYLKIFIDSASGVLSAVRAVLWLNFNIGAPCVLLPDQSDMSGLDSRSWKETVDLIDGWTGYSSPHHSMRQKESSMIMTSYKSTVGEEEYPTGAHIVGGEVVFWWLGRFYKFDGVRVKCRYPPPDIAEVECF